MQRLEEVLERIKKAGLKLKASKSYLLQNEVIFLGHVVSGEGIKPSPTNVTKVVDRPTPKTAKQVKQFVAMASYHRRYVRNLASTAMPMLDFSSVYKQTRTKHSKHKTEQKHKRSTKEAPPWNGQ